MARGSIGQWKMLELLKNMPAWIIIFVDQSDLTVGYRVLWALDLCFVFDTEAIGSKATDFTYETT